MSNSSDPYTPMERVHRLTRACLKILKDFRILIVTKSDLVTRDIDLLREMKASVSMSITTLDRELASKLEPFAPSPEKRLKALENLVNSGIPVSCRIDPIIPGLNEDAEELVENLSDIGVSHVISSTFKPRRDSWERFRKVFREEARMLQDLYFKKGQKVGNSFYLPKEIRFKLMEKIRRLSISKGMTFGACREGFANKGNCDGSWLI
jgi:DNA repair photolyase